MKTPTIVLFVLGLAAIGSQARAQAPDQEDLKMTALEALMSAPPERALPIVARVLAGDGSPELKQRALFVLGQIDEPEAREVLLETARGGEPGLRLEAIRAIGISGDPAAIAALKDLWAGGDDDTKLAILEAYLIADYAEGVDEIAANTDDPEEFEAAVSTLGAMDATEELRALRTRRGMSGPLIDAYAVAGDVESLALLARDADNPEQQVMAIHALGIAGDDEALVPVLKDIYRGAPALPVRIAVLEAFVLADQDAPLAELYRASGDPAEKRLILEKLVMLDSDVAWDVIDQTLEEDE